MKKYASLAAGLLLLVIGSAAQAEDAKPFVTNKDVDLTMILPPPPANDSAQTKAELGEVLTLQVTRTPEMEARAVADAEENVWRFADVMGPNFTKDKLPKFRPSSIAWSRPKAPSSIRPRMSGSVRVRISSATSSSRRSSCRAPAPGRPATPPSAP